ncbi:hypothetical protein FKP32DRAFT_700628 [Trametes sanguinea]|nr:hypothetical protein FKP32DRAFT_700628 [Trametes sanguinea]
MRRRPLAAPTTWHAFRGWRGLRSSIPYVRRSRQLYLRWNVPAERASGTRGGPEVRAAACAAMDIFMCAGQGPDRVWVYGFAFNMAKPGLQHHGRVLCTRFEDSRSVRWKAELRLRRLPTPDSLELKGMGIREDTVGHGQLRK